MTKLAVRPHHPASRVVFAGQSLLKTPPPTDNVVQQAMAGLGIPYANRGLGGCSWTLLLNGGDGGLIGEVLPADEWCFPFLGNATESLLVLLGGTSDILFEANDGAQTFADLVAYADAGRVGGATKVIAGTITPWTTATGPQETARTDHNALLMANTGGHFDGVFDVTVAPLDNPTNPAYYPDGLHWSPAGALVAAGIIQTAILAAL